MASRNEQASLECRNELIHILHIILSKFHCVVFLPLFSQPAHVHLKSHALGAAKADNDLIIWMLITEPLRNRILTIITVLQFCLSSSYCQRWAHIRSCDKIFDKGHCLEEDYCSGTSQSFDRHWTYSELMTHKPLFASLKFKVGISGKGKTAKGKGKNPKSALRDEFDRQSEEEEAAERAAWTPGFSDDGEYSNLRRLISLNHFSFTSKYGPKHLFVWQTDVLGVILHLAKSFACLPQPFCKSIVWQEWIEKNLRLFLETSTTQSTAEEGSCRTNSKENCKLNVAGQGNLTPGSDRMYDYTHRNSSPSLVILPCLQCVHSALLWTFRDPYPYPLNDTFAGSGHYWALNVVLMCEKLDLNLALSVLHFRLWIVVECWMYEQAVLSSLLMVLEIGASLVQFTPKPAITECDWTCCRFRRWSCLQED